MEWIVTEGGEGGKGNLQVSGLGNWMNDGIVNSDWEQGGGWNMEDQYFVWDLQVEMTVEHLDGGIQYLVGYGI